MKKALMTLCWLASSSLLAETEKATFGGGCFWCMEPPFESIHGGALLSLGMRVDRYLTQHTHR